jgi:hypothetical protein
MRVARQVVVLVVLGLIALAIVVLVNAPKWFDARPVKTTQPVAASPAT